MIAKKIIETTFYVRYAETDQMGVVHHSQYVIWFEEGRSAWMRALGSNYADFEAEGYNLSVAEVYAKYLAPAIYGRQVTVRTWTEDVKSRAMTICYEVVDAQSKQILVTGFTRHICIDKNKKVARIPSKWMDFFAGKEARKDF